MTQSTTTRTAKVVQVLARIQFKCDAKKVVYQVRSSNGADIYHTFLYDGKFASCQCPATKPCYHGIQCEALEAAHREAEETARAWREYADIA